MEFLVVFFWTNGTALFPTKKRNRLNRTIWSEVSDASWPGSGYISTRNKAAELPVVLDVLSDELENFFSKEEGDNFILLAAAASKFRQGNQQSAATLFSLDVSRSGQKRLEARIIHVKEKHKYRPGVKTTKRDSFSPAGLQLRRQILSKSKDTHCQDKHFGDLAAAIF